MDYKLYVEQYPNGNSCCTLFNDLKISKKIRWEKRRSLYDIWNDYNINIRVLTQMFIYKYIYILHDKYILVQYHYILFTIIIIPIITFISSNFIFIYFDSNTVSPTISQ